MAYRFHLLLSATLLIAAAGCGEEDVPRENSTEASAGMIPHVESDLVVMPAGPPLAPGKLEAAIQQACPLDLRQWRRSYGYRWMPRERRFEKDYVSFYFQRGPYPDLRPTRSWTDLRGEIQIDDRPGTLVTFGHYHLDTGTLDLEVGTCAERQ